VGHNDISKKEILQLFGDEKIFETPKPETLLQRILYIATRPGDLVLDSFLGSGTAAAVAHKMGRRYIGIELGEHAKTHCAVRLRKVIEGEQGGISKSVGWTGGGGFRFYTLGDTIFEEDGKIRASITFDQLAAHIWFYETKTPYHDSTTPSSLRDATPSSMKGKFCKSPFLGIHDGIGYALLYNGILGDKRVNGGNVLTTRTLEVIQRSADILVREKRTGMSVLPLVVYGGQSRLGAARLKELGVTFKQTPYDVKGK
jgi:adenine-specific DNA-methyltransferase